MSYHLEAAPEAGVVPEDVDLVAYISKSVSFNKMSYHLEAAPEAGVVPEDVDWWHT